MTSQGTARSFRPRDRERDRDADRDGGRDRRDRDPADRDGGRDRRDRDPDSDREDDAPSDIPFAATYLMNRATDGFEEPRPAFSLLMTRPAGARLGIGLNEPLGAGLFFGDTVMSRLRRRRLTIRQHGLYRLTATATLNHGTGVVNRLVHAVAEGGIGIATGIIAAAADVVDGTIGAAAGVAGAVVGTIVEEEPKGLRRLFGGGRKKKTVRFARSDDLIQFESGDESEGDSAGPSRSYTPEPRRVETDAEVVLHRYSAEMILSLNGRALVRLPIVSYASVVRPLILERGDELDVQIYLAEGGRLGAISLMIEPMASFSPARDEDDEGDGFGPDADEF